MLLRGLTTSMPSGYYGVLVGMLRLEQQTCTQSPSLQCYHACGWPVHNGIHPSRGYPQCGSPIHGVLHNVSLKNKAIYRITIYKSYFYNLVSFQSFKIKKYILFKKKKKKKEKKNSTKSVYSLLTIPSPTLFLGSLKCPSPASRLPFER